jgi:2-polyprenyl-3-methyl-5-hydroxy-6-metoxy-1,4-benzoquinol methylase
MQRADWLKQMRSMAEALYDRVSPQYWVTFGLYENATHRAYLQKFLERVAPGGIAGQPGVILSAGCGAGRYDGLLLEAGHSVVGIDQSAGMLARAREHFPQEHFPQIRYEKMSLQDIALNPAYREAFDGVICMDAMEHICPEDYPGILRGFQEALKPGGVLYFTVDTAEAEELAAAYERARESGLPVVPGEVVDEIANAYERAKTLGQPVPGDLADQAVYHYYPPLEQVRVWIDQAGLAIEEEGAGSGYHHFVAQKKKV